jgi:hypothetical protein
MHSAPHSPRLHGDIMPAFLRKKQWIYPHIVQQGGLIRPAAVKPARNKDALFARRNGIARPPLPPLTVQLVKGEDR